MSAILILFGAGVMLLALEVIVPGAILGIIGGLFMLAGVIAAFSQYGFSGGAVGAIAAVVIVGVVLYLEFVLLPKSRLIKKITVGETGAGQSQPSIAERGAVIGKSAVAVTSLGPSGVVECGGRRYEAFSRDGFVRVGEQLDIVDVDNFRLIVSKSTVSTIESKCPTG